MIEEKNSNDQKCLLYRQSGHVAADRKCKLSYGVILQTLLEKGLSIPDAAEIAESMMRKHYTASNDPEVDKDDDWTSEMHTVTKLDETTEEHENGVFKAYLRSKLESTKNVSDSSEDSDNAATADILLMASAETLEADEGHHTLHSHVIKKKKLLIHTPKSSI